MVRGLTVLGFVFLVSLTAAPAQGAGRLGLASEGDRSGLARFEGGWIDLEAGWGPARACLVFSGRPVECFRSASQMSRREARLLVPSLNCSSPLRLYDGLNRTGATVSIYTRGLWTNLSGLGFDNRTSSYSVGACAVELASGSGGGGSHYPGCVAAWCVVNSMASGWNNVVSSVYLY